METLLSLLSVLTPDCSFPWCFLAVNPSIALISKVFPSLLTPLYAIFDCTCLSLLYPHTFFLSLDVSALLHSPSLVSVLNFYLDSRWGLHADRLVVSKEQRCARSVPGLSLLQAADHALTSCHLTSDLLVGDVAITQGRHYWACSVEPGSYLVKASHNCQRCRGAFNIHDHVH